MDFIKDLSIDKVRNLAEDAYNQAKPKTEVEARVYEVLSHKNWGASSTLLNEIARDTFDYDKFAVISPLMWEAMENQRPAAWRVVFKGLTLLEHLIKSGSERCVDDARNHGHTLRALHKFNYYEGTVDRGSGVREKSKQIVEILSDDERVREERMKSRKMREKLGKLSGVSGGGGTYSGYGNDNWSSGGGGGGGDGDGYGHGGIGSDSAYRNGDGGGGRYGGRYDEDRETRSPTSKATEPSPTFASMPEAETKPAKKTKKKKKPEAAPAAPEVDLFSFDAPAPAAAKNADADEFDAFQSAGGSTPAPAPPPANDLFAAAPASFDAFGAAQQAAPMQQQQQTAQFDAFGNSGQPAMAGGMNANMAFAGSNNNTFGGPMNGGGMMMQQPMGGAVGGSSVMGAAAPAQNDDEFGDFADAAPSKATAAVSSDPMSRLISLDGLSKNKKKEEDKLNAPIVANAAAASFLQEKDKIQAAVQQSSKGSSMSFQGIDGLHKSSGMGMMGNNTMATPNFSMETSTGGGADAISSMMDPSALSQSNKTTMPQQQGMMNPQMAMANQQMMGSAQTMMGNPQMMGGNPQMMGGNMGMMNPGMQNFGSMPGNMMTPQQQQMMMNNQGMQGGMQGGMGMGGMQGGMQGNPRMNQQGMNQTGGQAMGGFR